MNLRKRKLAKRLAAVGSRVDEQYLLYVNNDEPICFTDYQSVIEAIQKYRERNEIFKLQIFRIETYSL